MDLKFISYSVENRNSSLVHCKFMHAWMLCYLIAFLSFNFYLIAFLSFIYLVRMKLPWWQLWARFVWSSLLVCCSNRSFLPPTTIREETGEGGRASLLPIRDQQIHPSEATQCRFMPASYHIDNVGFVSSSSFSLVFKIKGQTILNTMMMITYGFVKGKFEFQDRGQLTPSNFLPSTRNSPSTVNNDALPRVMTSCQWDGCGGESLLRWQDPHLWVPIQVYKQFR